MVEFYDPLAKTNISFHIDTKLKKMWDNIRDGKLINSNEDRVYIVDGRERGGKSSFVFQQAKYINPNFKVENICFTPDEFLHQIRTVEKGSVIVFDEAFRGLSSKSTRSKVNKAIVEALMEVGQRNLILFIVLPTIFLLEIYAAVLRSHCLFHIYKTKDKRRAFKIYNEKKKKELYFRGKTKFFSYSKPIIKKAKGRFLVKKNNQYPQGIPYETFDLKTYLDRKHNVFSSEKKDNDEPENKNELRFMKQRNILLIEAFENYNKFKKISEKKYCELLERKGIEMTQQNLSIIREKLAKMREKEQIQITKV
jgi:hypothetical protein